MSLRLSFPVKMSFREWIKREHSQREARRLVAEVFRDPALLAGTSLKPRHAARWVLVNHEVDGCRVVRVRFGIVRHPRPYAFSRQSHKVVEYYLYDVAARKLTRLEGRNITKERGEDAG